MQKKLKILFTVDDAYIPQIGASLTSFLKQNQEREVIVYIATEKDENTNNFKKLKKYYSSDKVIVKYLDCKKYDQTFEKLNLYKWGSKSYYVYWRLVAPEIIDGDYLLYLDADTICLGEFNEPNLYGKTVGCVIDSVHACYNYLLDFKEDFCFFNTGVMYIDLNKWKVTGATKKIIEKMRSVNIPFAMADQDYFSYAMQNEIQIIDPKYNYFVGYDYYGVDNSFSMYDLSKKKFYSIKEIKAARESVVFYHCLDGVFGRPWEEGNYSPIKKEYEQYRDQSAFPFYRKCKPKNAIYRVESMVEKILPRNMYNKIHNLMIKFYLSYKTR